MTYDYIIQFIKNLENNTDSIEKIKYFMYLKE